VISDALRALCERCGLAVDYHDVWGQRHAVAPQHLLALLGELGVGPLPADQPEACWQALACIDDAEWARALAPVQTAVAGVDRWMTRIRLPEGTRQAHWTLALEDGSSRQGDFELHHEHGRRQLGARWQIEWKVELVATLPAGYHRLRVEADAAQGEMLVIAAPPRCFEPAALADGGRSWGVAAQLYAVRSAGQWGMGDFTDLAQLAETAAGLGAGVVGLNPLHALFGHNPQHASPYSPSSRLHLNTLYIDVEAVAEFAGCEVAQRVVRSPEFQARMAALREAPLVEHAGVAACKDEVLRLLHGQFLALPPDHPRAQAFASFCAARGEMLRRHALFEALQAHCFAADPACWGWPVWPEPLRDPASAEVAAFASAHADAVGYFMYRQWLAEQQLQAAAQRCRAAGMPIGLYLDLAVSVDRAGSDVWGHQKVFAPGASIGAPPDEFNPLGQGWGLPPLHPQRLRESGYGLLVETLRTSMRSAGAIRIDHVMGFLRLYWIPAGLDARCGAYVHYRLDEILAIVALESQRARCLVIGEDLGTVTDETRAALSARGVLSYRLLWFEREGADFRQPPDYPREALVATSTHDLATLAGWWGSVDLQRRWALQLFPSPDIFDKQLLDRAGERVRLMLALVRAGVLDRTQVAQAMSAPQLPTEAVAAVHGYLARTPSKLMMVQLEDLLGEPEQANMPGTVNEHPNWRRKLHRMLADWAQDATVHAIAQAVTLQRPRSASAASDACTPTPIPGATYRLQLHQDFTFADAQAIVPYLARLGITHVYCSPIQRARAGSTHGYDVIEPGVINPELGGMEGFMAFTETLHAHGMGLLLDLVPNHMGVLGADNPWWQDVLENGRASAYADHFDIEWQPLDAQLAGKVLLPILGDAYGDILARGELVLAHDVEQGRLEFTYHAHRFPLAPESYAQVLRAAELRIVDAEVAAIVASIAAAFANLPGADGAWEAREREKANTHGRLVKLTARHASAHEAIDNAVAWFNAQAQRDPLHALLEAQHYRLAYWRVASDEINYRRFFDINELAALRIERAEVFEATQSLALDLAARGLAQGLRIDHPDGLFDPAQYFERLQRGFVERRGGVLPALDADGRPCRPLYVVAEKIAAPHEDVPASWHVHGTTGYRFANVANGVLIDGDAAAAFGRIWRGFTGLVEAYEAVVREGKRAVTRNALSSELTMLAAQLLRLARADRRTRDFTLNNLRRALAQVVACMTVYRTYIVDEPSAQDAHFIDEAVREAMRASELPDHSIFEFLRTSLLGRAVAEAPELQREALRFAARFQQFSAPVAAKGVEDMAFYRYFPLASINEVGGEPSVFGTTVAAFHAASADRAQRWPHTMLTTSTHDNKRGEDVRNRIDVLSEMPSAWRLALRRWHALNAPLRHGIERNAEDAAWPSPQDEYLFYQTVLGTWPVGGVQGADARAYADRLVRYMHKAAREAKSHTSWTHPDERYEAALEGFVRGALAEAGAGGANRFVQDMQPLAHRLARYGALNSLVLVTLKYTSPGVPDLYQGNELVDLSLVDPDNRRPVDYAQRASLLSEFEQAAVRGDGATLLRAAMASPWDGRAKLWTTWLLLQLRQRQPALFRDGHYQPLAVQGAQARHALAFARTQGNAALIVVTGRLFAQLDGVRVRGEREGEEKGKDAASPPGLDAGLWGDTALALPAPLQQRRWRDVLDQRDITGLDAGLRLDELLAGRPCAVLLALP